MSFLQIHATPGRAAAWVLSWFLFAAGITGYFYLSQQRHRDNPDDRIMPSGVQMLQAFQDAALKPAPKKKRSMMQRSLQCSLRYVQACSGRTRCPPDGVS